jgi:hypothetical protein
VDAGLLVDADRVAHLLLIQFLRLMLYIGKRPANTSRALLMREGVQADVGCGGPWHGEQPATVGGVGRKVVTVAEVGDVDPPALPGRGCLRTFVLSLAKATPPRRLPIR